MSEVITLTFGDMAENHVGMEQIGKLVGKGQGFQLQDLIEIKTNMENKGCECELINLSRDAYVLVMRNGVDKLLLESNKEQLFEEQKSLDYDKKAFMYGKVVNKNARWNLCFDEVGREPDYENKKGRIIGYSDIPVTKKLLECIGDEFCEKAKDLKIEANYYYDTKKCGIGFHGDAERRKVIGVRLGAEISPYLYFRWYYKGKSEGERISIPLNAGDIYIMSEKAVGTDWKKKNIFTLRHATGCDKFVA